MTITVLQQQTIASTPGDWSATVPFNEFDPSNGELLGAIFTTTGTIDASASIENLAPVAATINLSVNATIGATAPDIGILASLSPSAGASVNLGALQGPFDGSLDFGGPSGTVLPDLSASSAQTEIFQAGTSGGLPVVGSGTFDVAVSAYATSTVTGNGNLAVLMHSSEGAVVSLDYVAASPTAPGAAAADGMTFAMDAWYALLADIFVYGPIVNLVTTTPQVVALASQTSGWSGTASLNQFNPALGTLVDVILNVGNSVAGTFSAENLDNVAATVTMNETASMMVTAPALTSGVTATAATGDGFSLGAYDGSADFAGSSGQSDTITGPSSEPSGSTWLADSTDLAAFTGSGTIALPVSTSGTSTVTGPANLLSEITQHTGGTVSVSYVYEAPSVSKQTAAPPLTSAVQASMGVGVWAASAPGLTFIGGLGSGSSSSFDAEPNETFLIGAGANATIGDFSVTGGVKLNLTSLLGGAALTADLSNLGAFLRVTAVGADANGGFDTTLGLNGPGGTGSVTLVSKTPIAVADLLNDNVLILPPH